MPEWKAGNALSSANAGVARLKPRKFNDRKKNVKATRERYDRFLYYWLTNILSKDEEFNGKHNLKPVNRLRGLKPS